MRSLSRGIGPLSGNAILAENDGGDITIARSGGMTIESDEGVPEPESLGAPMARRAQQTGGPCQDPPQHGKLVDGGADPGDAGNDEVQTNRSA